jgi:hypothetical protein
MKDFGARELATGMRAGRSFASTANSSTRKSLYPLQLLSDPRFKGADDEFRAAHDHYKAGEYKDCAVDALNALESTMKIICDLKVWAYQHGARSSDLLKVLKDNGLFPEFAEKSFDQFVATLKFGLPALRNESGAHG